MPRSSSPSSRPPLERMMRIHEELKQERRPNCTSLASLLEVSTKTIMRDIEFMRDRLNLPIEYLETEYAYSYNGEVDAFPTVQVTEGEVFALLVAQKAMEQYKGTPFEHTLESAFGKIVSGLRDNISFKPSASGVSFKNVGVSEANIQVFQELNRAINMRLEVRFSYHKLGDEDSAKRHVEPYHMACIQGAWYLVCNDLDRGAMRTFSLARLSHLHLGKRTFERRADFSVDRYFANSFGVYTGEGTQEVRILFDAVAGRIVSERFWHGSQTVTALPDGSVELSLRVGDLRELENWVLGWGPQARVLAPKALALRVRKAARALIANYESADRG